MCRIARRYAMDDGDRRFEGHDPADRSWKQTVWLMYTYAHFVRRILVDQNIPAHDLEDVEQNLWSQKVFEQIQKGRQPVVEAAQAWIQRVAFCAAKDYWR